MKLIVAGSRTFTDYQLLCQTLAPQRHLISAVLHGGARGADQLGFRWALKHHVRSRCFAADWERFGKSAGVRRNISRWRRQVTCSSPSGMGSPQARPAWCSACTS
jgi:hypothetical protein